MPCATRFVCLFGKRRNPLKNPSIKTHVSIPLLELCLTGYRYGGKLGGRTPDPERTVTTKQRMKRNLNPHAEAVAAMWMWGERYSKQGGGSMDFWDALSDYERSLCVQMVTQIQKNKVRA
jgi:hypothetical protein